MGLKRSIVVVGSVLVLAACDSATGPTGPLSLHDGPAASAKKTAPGTTTGPSMNSMTDSGCGWIHSGGEGSDSIQVCVEQ